MQASERPLIQPPGPDRTTAPPGIPVNSTSPGGQFVRQPYESYSSSEHAVWAAMYRCLREHWLRHASERFLDGLGVLQLPSNEVPRLDQVNARLAPRSGFRTTGVNGFLPSFQFFDCLRSRVLPTAVVLRGAGSLDTLPEFDLFHDLAGHVPLLVDRTFAESLVAFGDCAHSAAEIAGLIRDPGERRSRLQSILKALGRFYWFTVEFGLLLFGDRLKAYGGALLSSAGELEHALDSPRVQRCPMNLEWVIHQPFELNRYQPLLFIVESFGQLLELTRTLERWMWEGRLDHVAAGEPETRSADLESYFEACGLH